jgi:hypothetical protein
VKHNEEPACRPRCSRAHTPACLPCSRSNPLLRTSSSMSRRSAADDIEAPEAGLDPLERAGRSESTAALLPRLPGGGGAALPPK